MKPEQRRFGCPQDEVLLHLLENKGTLTTKQIVDLMYENQHTIRVWEKGKTGWDWVFKTVPGGPNFRYATLQRMLNPLIQLRRIIQHGKQVTITIDGESYILYRIKWAIKAGKTGFKLI